MSNVDFCQSNSRRPSEEETDLQRKKPSLADAIRIQRELKRDGCQAITAEWDSRMFAEHYASPLQMLRRKGVAALPGKSSELRTVRNEQHIRRRNISLSISSADYSRAEPCVCYRKGRGKSGPRLASEAKTPPFPSIAARLENDVALGLAASLWDSGNVVGHCDDRLAHLLVLSSTIVQWMMQHGPSEKTPSNAQCNTEKVEEDERDDEGKVRCVPLELREAFIAIIEHLVRLERVATNTLLPKLHKSLGQQQLRGSSTESTLEANGAKTLGVEFRVAVAGAARVLKGLVEPATLATRTSISSAAPPTWQYSLVRTAADVPNRYDILDAMAYVLQPCPQLKVRHTFYAVARRLALDTLRDAGSGRIGVRGGLASIRILQHINTRSMCLCVEEREGAMGFLTALEQRLRCLKALLPPEVLDEATQITRRLIDAVRIFCGPPT